VIVQDTVPAVSVEAFESLATLQQLALEAGLSESLEQLAFRMLNRSVGYCRYDRAALWSFAGPRCRLLGVSGGMRINPQSALVNEWRNVIAALRNRDAARVLAPDAFADGGRAWDRLAQRTRELSVLWLPIRADGRTVAGLWLERWSGERFAERDRTRCEPLALSYGVAWRGVSRRRGVVSRLISRRRCIAALAAVAVVAILGLVRVPLRIVSPCEVVPKDPLVVAAPLSGVIDEIPVLPGREVAAGDLLAVYDKRVALEEIKVAQEQVQIIRSDLQRARVQAFDDPQARAEIALLENRLEQERIRLGIAQHRVDQLEVRAPIAGTLMFDDPHEWRGRPVQVGQRLMMIVDPQRTKLRIWLPEHDNIDFDSRRPLTVILASDPRSSRPAALRFLANHSQVNGAGVVSFRAEAEWLEPQPDAKLGLQGTAVLYGRRAPLGYWLLRRPFAAARGFFGF
jgi:hypothetical protein